MKFIRIEKGKIRISKSIQQKDQQIFKVYAKKVYLLNKKFWDFGIPLIKIGLVYTRKDFDKEWGSKTERWACAMTNKNRIIIFAPSVFEHLTDYKLSYYTTLLAHEMNHTFYENFVCTYKPVWIMEGLAMIAAKQGNNWRGKINSKCLFYTYKNKNMIGEIAKQFYRNSYLMTKKLIVTRRKNEIISFLKKYKQHPNVYTYMQFKKQLPF